MEIVSTSTVDISGIVASGGSEAFMITVSEAGEPDIVYLILVYVAAHN